MASFLVGELGALRKRVVSGRRVVMRKKEKGRVLEVEDFGQFIMAGLVPRLARLLGGRGKSRTKCWRDASGSSAEKPTGIKAQAPDCFE